MTSPYYAEKGFALYSGEARAVLADFRKNSIDCLVTSPPYYEMKDYGDSRQIGWEDTFRLYTLELLDVFAAAWRVLRPDGTVWVNIGDKWTKNEMFPAYSFAVDMATHCGYIPIQTFIWHKTNATPYGAKRRQTLDHEYFFAFAKHSDYYWDRKAVMVPAKWERWGKQGIKKDYRGIKPIDMESLERRRQEGKPVRTVWTMPTKPYPGQHMAPFPPELAARCIRLGCRPKGRVLDPFCGSGASGVAAKLTRRQFFGIDIVESYLDDAVERYTAGA